MSNQFTSEDVECLQRVLAHMQQAKHPFAEQVLSGELATVMRCSQREAVALVHRAIKGGLMKALSGTINGQSTYAFTDYGRQLLDARGSTEDDSHPRLSA